MFRLEWQGGRRWEADNIRRAHLTRCWTGFGSWSRIHSSSAALIADEKQLEAGTATASAARVAGGDGDPLALGRGKTVTKMLRNVATQAMAKLVAIVASWMIAASGGGRQRHGVHRFRVRQA